VRISGVRVEGRSAYVTLRLIGDVTTLRLDSGQRVRRRHFSEPGVHTITELFTYSAAGSSYRAKIRAEGGFRPGCGTSRRRYATAERTIVIR
jgi:hypothetical protein